MAEELGLSRRELFVGAAAFASLASVLRAMPALAAEYVAAPETADLSVTRVFRYADLPVANYANGGSGHAVLHGTLPTGEFVECHETVLPPGEMPHPPHKHPNTEFVIIREGHVEFQNDGKPEPAGPGDVIFTASNVMHGLKNIGTVPARYMIVSIGVQVAE